MTIETFTPRQEHHINALANAVLFAHAYEDILNEHRVSQLSTQMKRHDVENSPLRTVVIDRKLIKTMKDAGFAIYEDLKREGLVMVANEIMQETGIPQIVNHERLMQIDQEYQL